jgi:hypothetical protein
MKLPTHKLRRHKGPILVIAAIALSFGVLALTGELWRLALADVPFVVKSVITDHAQSSGAHTLIIDGNAELAVAKMAFGAVSVDKIGVTASTESQYGYTLTLSSSNGQDGLQCDVEATNANFSNGKCSAGDSFKAIKNPASASGFSTLATPGLLNEDSWGFAVAKSDTGAWQSGFSDSYEVGDNRFGQAERSLWSSVPSGNTVFRRTLFANEADTEDDLEVYSGVRSSRDTKVGVYKATVTISILSNELVNTQEFFVERDPSMFAVKYDGSKWVIANERNTNNDWYNYVETRWANAIIPKAEFLGNVNGLSIGEEVPENWILSWLVYIPRFRYQVNTVTDADRPPVVTRFNIAFENMFTSFYHKEPINHETKTGDWVVHPAFTIGDTELSGFWISKFPITNADGGRHGAEPNQPLISYTPSVWWNTLRSSDGATNFRRPNSLTAETDSHMIKNAEWAAVTYLALSNYGRGTTEIGWSSGNTGSGPNWKTNIIQTTTGNPTGVYDMNGRTTLVLGNFNKTLGASGFADLAVSPGLPYVDVFNATSLENCSLSECLGQGLFEIAGWYGVSATLPNAANPWITRGNNGIYAFSNSTGAASTTRVVLTRNELLRGYCAKNSNAEICQ